MPRKRTEIIYQSTEATYRDLKHIESTSEATKRYPRELLLDSIIVADSVFQPRCFYEDGKLDHHHISELVSGIKASKYDPLDPMLVVPLGGKFYLVDGHHRYAAYRSLDPRPWASDRPVPVEVFRGSLDAAVLECGIRNSKNKLPMSVMCKREYAWNLVKLGVGSINDQHRASGLAKSSISRMRKALEELGDAKAEGMLWWDVLRNNQQRSERDSSDYFDLKAQQLADNIKRSTDIKLLKHCDVLADAIDIIHPSLLDKVIQLRTGFTMAEIGASMTPETLDI